jgi:hypothetical protein
VLSSEAVFGKQWEAEDKYVANMHALTGVVYASTQQNPRVLVKCEMRHKAEDRTETGPANKGWYFRVPAKIGTLCIGTVQRDSAVLLCSALSRDSGRTGHHNVVVP